MTPKEANEHLLKIMMTHIMVVQGGELGTPTMDDLEFCGRVHCFLEDFGIKATIAEKEE